MYVLEFDELPPTLNNWLSGTHWRTKNRDKQEWNLRMLAAFRKIDLPKPLQWPLTISVTQFCKRERDTDNVVLGAKFCADSLVVNGYLPDDSPTYIPTVILQSKKGKENKLVVQLL